MIRFAARHITACSQNLRGNVCNNQTSGTRTTLSDSAEMSSEGENTLEQELSKEWSEFQTAAIKTIRLGRMDKLEVSSQNRVLQILFVPSFEDVTSWEIIKVTKFRQVSYYLVRSIWLRNEDIEKFRTPVERLKYPRPCPPTVKYSSSQLERDFIEDWIKSIEDMELSLAFKDAGFQIDGNYYEICFESFLTGLRIWWQNPPTRWKAFTDRVMELMSYLQRIVQD
jgi:hypothetical protein